MDNVAETIDCPRCSGARYVLRPARPGDTHSVFSANGPAVLGPCPVCNGTDRRQEYLRSLCRLTEEELTHNFADWKPDKHQAMVTGSDGRSTKANGAAVLRVAQRVLETGGWLTLAGPWGNGKSYLLTAIVNEAVQANRKAVYVKMADMLDHLRRGYKPGAEVDSDSLWELITRCDVLCIDEAEKWNTTPWAEEKAMQMAEDRYRRAGECVTCWAVNDAADLPPYLKSRMTQFPFIVMAGKDIRPELKR